MNEAKVQSLLNALPLKARKLIVALRKVIHRNVPQAEESILWGGLSYHRPQIGGRVKGAVCQIGFNKGQVRLDFIHGFRLHDALGILQGNLKSKRFVVIETVKDAKRPEIATLIREAAALDPAQW